MTDNQPRYTTKRLHEEVAKAKLYARREALEEAAQEAEKATVRMGYGILSLERNEAIEHRDIIAKRIRALATKESRQ